MTKEALGEVSNQEIISKRNNGMSKTMLINYVSAITGLKGKEAQAVVEKAIYEDWMKNK